MCEVEKVCKCPNVCFPHPNICPYPDNVFLWDHKTNECWLNINYKPEAQEPITGTALQAMDMEKELRKNMPDYDTPLAVLAGRKGKTSRIMVLHYNDKWDEFQSEAECREYLLSLPDKGEGK